MACILFWSSAMRVHDSAACKKVDVSPGTWSLSQSQLLSIYFDLCVDATGVFCHQLGLLGTDLHAVGYGGFVETLNQFCQFFPSPAKPSMSSAKRRLVTVLPSMLTVPSRSSKASVMILSRNMSKRVGERKQLIHLLSLKAWNFRTTQSNLLLFFYFSTKNPDIMKSKNT